MMYDVGAGCGKAVCLLNAGAVRPAQQMLPSPQPAPVQLVPTELRLGLASRLRSALSALEPQRLQTDAATAPGTHTQLRPACGARY
jgi:hypothetical protein